MSSSIVCSLSGNPVTQAVISKKTGHIYEKSTISCHIKAFGTCPHTNIPLNQSDLIPIITGNSTSLLTPSSTISQSIQKLSNQYDQLILQAYTNKEQLQKLRQQLAVSLYHQDAALRVIARLKGELKGKRQEIINVVEQIRLNNVNTI